MKKTSYLWNFVLIAVITIVALWFALKDNYQEVVHAIGKLNGFSLTIILVWGILYTCVWGLVYVVLGRKFKKKLLGSQRDRRCVYRYVFFRHHAFGHGRTIRASLYF